MALKRSRVNRSKKTAGDGEVVAARPRASQRLKPRMPPARPSIFDISPPLDEMAVIAAEDGVRDQDFLERCFYCTKSFCSTNDVFMYSDLRAFCTKECRLKHLEIEGDEELVKALKKTKTKSDTSKSDAS